MASNPGGSRKKMGFKKILVVDDDEPTRFLCSEALSLAGYKVETAANGLEALVNLKNSAYGAVISDIDMPGLDGVDFYFRTISEQPYLKDRFIFITGNASGDRAAALSGIKKKTLVKPFRVAELITAVERIMSKPAIKLLEPGKGNSLCVKAEDDKRIEERFRWTAECSLFEDGIYSQRFLACKTKDISRNGVKIKYYGELLIPHTFVDIFIEVNKMPLNRHAKVVWSKFMGRDEATAGLRFSEPIPMSSIIPLQNLNNPTA